MTTLEQSLPDSVPQQSAPARATTWWDRFDAIALRSSEWLNPILVKETRQALKSRQFSITFTLVLACAWGWSMLGVSMIGPDIYHGFYGYDMFSGYFVILAFPLLVIVPFGAFRSLAAEREDGTYELLSVTTLRPRQIVSGKLGSAVVQMLVYLSAVSPCLAFTYMLKGIDFPTVLCVLYYSFLGSLGLSAIGLVVATATTEKHWQIVLSVALLFGLGFCFFTAMVFILDGLSRQPIPFQDPDFWAFNAAMLTGFAGYFVFFFFVAAAQLTFASDNRSSLLRAVMLAQQALFTGWMGWLFIDDGELEYLLPYLAFSGLHWSIMGMFMNGESTEMSARVKRQLPQSFLGRTFFTWFNPGPATGYLFAIVNFFGVCLLAGVALLANLWFFSGRTPGWAPAAHEMILILAVLELCYITIYLGVGRLLSAGLRWLNQPSMLLSVLCQVLMVLIGCGIPLTIHLMMVDLRQDYSLIEISNPFWSLIEVVEARSGPTTDVIALLLILPVAAAVVFLANLPSVVTAVRQVRIAKPQRVAEEDEFIELQRNPPQPIIDPLAD